jgi:hypothetical protein
LILYLNLNKHVFGALHVTPIYKISFKIFDILYILPLSKLLSSEIRSCVVLILLKSSSNAISPNNIF